jgi:hypothetical protein
VHERRHPKWWLPDAMSNDIVARHTMNDVVEYLHSMSREDLDEKHANVLKTALLFFYNERCGTPSAPIQPKYSYLLLWGTRGVPLLIKRILLAALTMANTETISVLPSSSCPSGIRMLLLPGRGILQLLLPVSTGVCRLQGLDCDLQFAQECPFICCCVRPRFRMMGAVTPTHAVLTSVVISGCLSLVVQRYGPLLY